MGADFLWHSLLSYDFCAGEGELSFVCVVIFAVDLSGFFASSLSQLFQPKAYDIWALWLKSGNRMPDRSDGVLSYRATLVRISYEFPYFSQSSSGCKLYG